MRRRMWIVFTFAAMVLMIVAGWSAVRPQGRAVDGQVEQECARGVWAFLPSDPLAESDPKYAVSEECHDRTMAAGMLAFLAGAGSGALVLAAILSGVTARRRRAPLADPPLPARWG